MTPTGGGPERVINLADSADPRATSAPHATSTPLGAATVSTYRGAAGSLLRHDPALDADHEALHEAFVAVGTQSRGTAVLTDPRRSMPCATGDVFLVDMAEPWELRQSDPYRLHLFRIPRRAVSASADELRAAQGVHGHTDDSVTRILAPFLTTIADSAAAYPERVARDLAGHVADLLGTLAASAAGQPAAEPDESGGRRAMLWRIRHFVNENLDDPELSPELIAARHHVSVRYVHKVFADEGTTLSRWIRRRRLEECRRELARLGPTDPAPSFAAVARRWGFANSAHFSRSFRAAYGMSPSEWHRIRTASGDDALRGPQAGQAGTTEDGSGDGPNAPGAAL
ncbi:helix-turn-helix domain-containing protein [Streptomyces sp. NPDC048297]|uniref:helix-turn-helix domain-containing protein n=1 Tax=Streptomyces sp. NPDC048297 TaxID=3365531 RepID=UPI0037110B59